MSEATLHSRTEQLPLPWQAEGAPSVWLTSPARQLRAGGANALSTHRHRDGNSLLLALSSVRSASELSSPSSFRCSYACEG
jgi:hypothetical protein